MFWFHANQLNSSNLFNYLYFRFYFNQKKKFEKKVLIRFNGKKWSHYSWTKWGSDIKKWLQVMNLLFKMQHIFFCVLTSRALKLVVTERSFVRSFEIFILYYFVHSFEIFSWKQTNKWKKIFRTNERRKNRIFLFVWELCTKDWFSRTLFEFWPLIINNLWGNLSLETVNSWCEWTSNMINHMHWNWCSRTSK